MNGRGRLYKHILIATDGSELAGRALAHGLALAKELNVPVTVVTVTQLWSAPEMALFSAGKANLDPVRQFEDMAAAAAKVILDAAAQKSKAAGVTCELVHDVCWLPLRAKRADNSIYLARTPCGTTTRAYTAAGNVQTVENAY